MEVKVNHPLPHYYPSVNTLSLQCKPGSFFWYLHTFHECMLIYAGPTSNSVRDGVEDWRHPWHLSTGRWAVCSQTVGARSIERVGVPAQFTGWRTSGESASRQFQQHLFDSYSSPSSLFFEISVWSKVDRLRTVLKLIPFFAFFFISRHHKNFNRHLHVAWFWSLNYFDKLFMIIPGRWYTVWQRCYIKGEISLQTL